MLRFWRNKSAPIGIDLGSASLKILQVSAGGGTCTLTGAARAEVPAEVQGNAQARHEWQVRTVQELLRGRRFKGKKAVTCLPAYDMTIQHVRLPKMDDAQLPGAVRRYAQQVLPFNVERALLRHLPVGEVIEDAETKLEVVLLAARYEAVQRHLDLIERVGLDVEAVNVEPTALVSGFAALLQAEAGQEHAVMLVDLGHGATKVVVAHGGELALARVINIGGRQLQGAAEQDLGEQSKRAVQTRQLKLVDSLGEQLRGCVRYHDLVFEARPVERIIFLGGLARYAGLCRKLAENVHLPAQLGDPVTPVAERAGTTARGELPLGENLSAWTVAFGLSVGALRAPGVPGGGRLSRGRAQTVRRMVG